MIVTTAQLYKVAYGKFAVGAYNINNMEQLLGLFGGNVQSSTSDFATLVGWAA
jgi:fructose-bisphosphate aldolase, class II